MSFFSSIWDQGNFVASVKGLMDIQSTDDVIQWIILLSKSVKKTSEL